MTQRDWLSVGAKLIGLYFAVLGITTSVMVGTNIVVQALILAGETGSGSHSVGTNGVSFLEVSQPLAYLLCAWVLLKRTDWCVRISGPTNFET